MNGFLLAMKTSLRVGLSLLAVASLTPCLAGPKEDVQAAVARWSEAANYTWTARTEVEGSNWGGGTTTGKAAKGGWAVLSQTRQDATTMAVRKGEVGVVKTDAGWQTAEEIRSARQAGGGGGGGVRGTMLLWARMPAEDAKTVLANIGEMKESEGAMVGMLSEAGAKELLSLNRGRGGQGQRAEARDAKGSVRFWLKDGQVAKMEMKLSGTFTMNNEDRNVVRTTTYEIKDIGTTMVNVPADAKAKLGS
jgi:hypothetical protein